MWTLVILLPLTWSLPQSQENKLEKNKDFVIGSSCAVEAFSPQGKLDLSKLDGWVDFVIIRRSSIFQVLKLL